MDTRPVPRGLLPCLTLTALGGSFVAALGTPLIPTIAADRHVSFDVAQWNLTIALLVGAVMTPLISRWGDGGRRRRVLITVLVITIVGALTAATAPTFAQLLVGRAMQGAGYAIAPVAIGIAREYLTGPRLHRAVASLAVTIAVGTGIGNPIVGGLTTALDYRAAFYFAGAFGLASLAWFLRVVPAPPSGTQGAVQWDIPGAIVLSVGLGALLLGISRGETWHWTSAGVLILGGVGLALLAVFVVLELRAAAPLIDLRLAAIPAVLGANVATMFVGMAMFSGTPITVRLVQTPASEGYGFGASTLTGAMLLFAFSIGSLASQFVLNPLTRLLGARRLLALSAGVIGVGWLSIALFHGAIWHIGLAMTVSGFGMGLVFSILPQIIVAAVPDERTTSASGLNTVLRLIGGTLGSAGCAAILTAHTEAGSTYPTESGIRLALICTATACLLSAITGLAFVRGSSRSAPTEVDAVAVGNPDVPGAQ